MTGTIQTRPLTDAFGVEVIGVDTARGPAVSAPADSPSSPTRPPFDSCLHSGSHMFVPSWKRATNSSYSEYLYELAQRGLEVFYPPCNFGTFADQSRNNMRFSHTLRVTENGYEAD